MFLGKARVSTVVRARRVNAVLVADHFPELRADLVAALATLRGVVPKETQKQFPFSTSDELELIPLKSEVDVCAEVRLAAPGACLPPLGLDMHKLAHR